MSDKKLPLLHYYEAELIPMGRLSDGTLTADDDLWTKKESDILNIYVTLRDPNDDTIIIVMDLDIPASMPELAIKLFNRISSEVNFSNRQRILLK